MENNVQQQAFNHLATQVAQLSADRATLLAQIDVLRAENEQLKTKKVTTKG